MLLPMLEAFAQEAFLGRCGNEMNTDSKAWDGTCWGHEGFLVDDYCALLAVLDREAARARAR